ncbi:MAG TPA: hypothetical protein VHN79_06140 [Lacunisphaera sp.]|nr:hypothetical protein [Lacunisphaera sp.]
MPGEPQSDRLKAQLKIWWVLWGAILSGLVVIYLLFGRGPVKAAPDEDVLLNLIGLIPLFISIVIRWLVLPRYDDLQKAFPVFIVGLALGESCGILGIFLGGAYRDDLFVLGVLGVMQFMPVFAKQLTRPKGQEFIPNN